MNRIDLTRPDAPELAAFGPHAVGVETLHLINPDQIDVLATPPQKYDRPLCVELWFPCLADTGAVQPYRACLRDGHTWADLHGAARRGATQMPGDFPLVILSHGYPGNRYLMSHLAEKLASRGYVVAAIDHTDSTYDAQRGFASTLVNRPKDTAFVRHALSARADVSRYAIIGYSMGGYGALVSAGAGVSERATKAEYAPPAPHWQVHQAPIVDPGLKAIIAIGPWGRQVGLWQAEGLAKISVPMMLMAGSQDHVSGYEKGMRRIFDEATGTERHLLTFQNAGHNAAAPIPAPTQAWARSAHLDFTPFEHYADPVWDTLAMNNIAQHAAVAFLVQHLQGQHEFAPYLTGDFQGFAPGTEAGLTWEIAPRSI